MVVILQPSLPVDAQLKDNTEGWSSSFEGGRGLMYMNSARTYGKGRVVAGLQGLIMPREYLMKGYPKGSYEDNTTAVCTVSTDYFRAYRRVGYHWSALLLQ